MIKQIKQQNITFLYCIFNLVINSIAFYLHVNNTTMYSLILHYFFLTTYMYTNTNMLL